MRKLQFSMIAAVSLLAVPALAQDSSSSSSKSSCSQSPQNVQQITQELKQDFSKAGYTDIQVAPGSFLVHAKDKQGQPTEMTVTPNSLTAVTEVSKSNGSSSGGSSSSGTSSNSSSK